MRYLTILTLIFTQIIFCQNKKEHEAIRFIESLKKEKIKSSTEFHVIPNRYLLTDLNNDTIFEVIEITNKIEDEIPDFLPVELSSAFDYHKIYFYDNEKDKFILSDFSDFSIYRKEREYFYRAWYNLISYPKDLNQNLKKLINENKKYFLNEINKLLIRVKN